MESATVTLAIRGDGKGETTGEDANGVVELKEVRVQRPKNWRQIGEEGTKINFLKDKKLN